jgi:alginate O-acetyltransferase complex protein AlgI
MVFASITFIYYFLPAVLVLYFITPVYKGQIGLRNFVLLIASMAFYYWGGYDYFSLIIAQVVISWVCGLLIDKWRGTTKAVIPLLACIFAGIGALIYYKYADFFIANFNAVTRSDVKLLNLVLPIGISFYTFQIISYTVDLYKGKIAVQKNLITLATYTMFFPQLIAGPIIRYADVEQQFVLRKHTFVKFSCGARRFVFGLGKKVLIANTLSELLSIIKLSGENSVLSYWLAIVCCAFYVYYDFSGYSDMAIGLAMIFGFHFLENFNYPYIAKSITDFWRRWHMSLSYWFRDYVYIPLGGNRKRAIFNIMFVWFLTGFWHGANWNFIAWGIFFGLVLLLEKFILKRVLDKSPILIRHIYVLFIVLVSWNFFDSDSMTEALLRIGGMFGIGADSLAGSTSLYYLNSYAFMLIIAAFGATPIPKILAQKLIDSKPRIAVIAEPLSVTVFLLTITAFLADGSFNPFIYFRF